MNKKYNIPTRYDSMDMTRKNDHEDRVAIFFASDYIKDYPIPKYVKPPKKVWNKAAISAFARECIRYILP